MYMRLLKTFLKRFSYEIEWYLRKCKWYRRRKGGQWYRVRPDYYGVYGSYWIHSNESLNNMTILETEKYFYS